MIRKGFTLIELLIVIAILGTLAVVILVAINPLEQLRKTRDSGRQSTVAQLGHALDAYAVTNSGSYTAVTLGANWIGPATTAGSLVAAGEISVVPAAIAYSPTLVTACTGGGLQNGYCYKVSTSPSTGPVVVYTRLEALVNTSKCPTGQIAYTVYSTADGRGGVVCSATEPTAGTQTFQP